MNGDTDDSYFDDLYARDADLWGFDTSDYERRKHELTVAALPDRMARRALEPGCSNGALTERLAMRCSALYAFDRVPAAVERARRRVAHLSHVTVATGRFPQHWPPGDGDLVVWSEVAYYLGPASATLAIDGLDRWLVPGGAVVAVHYTGATDYPRHGAEIGPWLDSCRFLRRTTTLVDEQFELGVWRRER